MSKATNGANLGFESKLWEMADKMRGHMDASEYKHVVLGLIFLKYISDAFQHKYDELAATRETEYTDPEDRDEYLADNIFWVPPEARWERIQAQAPQPVIGKVIDEAMTAIERENPSLRGVLPKDYSRPTLDKTRLGELVKLVGDIDLKARESGVRDPLGRVYEYFLGNTGMGIFLGSQWLTHQIQPMFSSSTRKSVLHSWGLKSPPPRFCRLVQLLSVHAVL